MKKIFNFTKKKKHPSGTPDNGSVLSAGYELRDKDLGKAHKAAFQGDLAKLKQLAKKNDLNQLDKENRTPLHIACACGNADVVQFLVENKAKLNLCDNQNRSALMKAVQCQHERCVRILLENHAEPNLVDINGNTALHLASNIPSLSTATLLLQHDADNGAPNQEGFTPLTVAVREDHVEMAEFLLSEGADVNYLDRDQRSPLMMAAGNGQVGMLRLLLRFNADITLKDSKGWSADDYAVMNGHHPCSLLIIEHGTQRRDGPSLSHQGPNKKKKPTLLGSPSQDLGAGFSLEGPATDKDDFEDSSQSESISRVSKSAADEWPSSEDDDESVSVEKKLLKVNLRKLIASKKGEAPALPDRTLSDTESDLESENRAAPSPQRALPSSSALQLPVDPSPLPFLSKAPQMTSTPLPSNVKAGGSDEREKSKLRPKTSDRQSSEEEDSEGEDNGDEEEEDEEEMEEEEEDNEDDDDDDNDDDDDDDDEDEDEEEEEEEEADEDSEESDAEEDEDGTSESSAVAKISVPEDLHQTATAAAAAAAAAAADEEALSKTQPQSDDVSCLQRASPFPAPGSLGVEEDCVVSAIRVESKFSDDDESIGRESTVAPQPNVSPRLVSPPQRGVETHLASGSKGIERKRQSVKEEEEEEEDDEGAETEPTGSPSAEDDDGSKEEQVKKEKRRSSWGSSLEDSDVCDSPKEDEADKETSALPSNSALSQHNEDPLVPSSPSPSPDFAIPPENQTDEYKSLAGPSRTRTLQSRSRPGESGADESDWDSSESRQVPSPVSRANLTEKQTVEERCSGGSVHDNDGLSNAKEPRDFYPDTSPEPDDQNKNEVENPTGEDSMWDTEDEAEELENLNKGEEEILKSPLSTTTNLPRPEVEARSPGNKTVEEDEEVSFEMEADEGSGNESPVNGCPEGVTGDRSNPEARTGLESDNEDQNFPCHAAIATVTGSETEDDSCKNRARSAAESEEKVPPEDVLPQTDIDGVDLDSSDDAGEGGERVRKMEGLDIQKEDSTEDDDEYDDDDDEEEKDRDDDDDEEEEEDPSDEESERSEDLPAAASNAPRAEISEYQKKDSFLGLEKGDPEQESWDSESEELSAPRNDKPPSQSQDGNEAAKEHAEETGVHSPRDTKSSHAATGSERVSADASAHKETDKAKWEPFFSKLEEDHKKKTDLMEELGLADVDDLEDTSDWDSASIASKKTLSGPRMASPGHEALQGRSNTPAEKEKHLSPSPPLSPSTSVNNRPVPPPQPCARKTVLQEAEAKANNQQRHTAELPTAAGPGSSELPELTRERESALQPDEQQQKEKDRALEPCASGLNNSCKSGQRARECGDKGNGLTRQREDGGQTRDLPWEKRYEKLWVEVEKREVKSTFKNVAGELKEKFGELLNSRRAEEKRAESSSPEDESSEEEEVMVVPAARARSVVLLAIPEQRESGPEDSYDNSKEAEENTQSGRSPEPSLGSDLHTRSMLERDRSHKQPPNPISKSTEEDGKKICRPSSRPGPGGSDEELEENPDRFEAEVGTPKCDFLDLEKQKTRPWKEVSKETTRAAHMDQIFSPTLGIDPTATGLPGNEKPRTTGESRKKLSSQPGAAEHELRTATKSVGRSSRSPRATDSSTSDASDDEGRLKTGDHLKNENQEEMEMDEDFDELTQSSGTATDDMDSPTSGYRHASLLIQKLDSVTFDSRSMVKLQNIFHEYERSIQKARSRQGYLSDKVSQLEMERAELKTSLEGVKDDKSALERNQLELQTEITNLKFQLKQEQENGRNATMMYNSSRDKLRRTEEQHQLEVQERQKVELTLRNLELEMRTMVNNKKRLEEEHSQTQRLLAQERSARTMQENLLNSHLRKQQEIEEENKRNMSKSNEALSQLTEASDRERELLQHNSSLQEQLNMVKLDLEHSQANRSIRDRELLEENEALKEQLEDARRDLKLNSDALNQTVLTCNNQIITLKAELTISTNRVENERQARETLAAEAESVRSRLAGAVQEAERSMAALSDAERALLREREEHQRLKDRLSGEASSQREAVNSLSQKLTKEEARANSMENEVHRVTMQLTEKGLLLDVLQREKDQLAVRVKELESSLQAEKELLGRAGSRQEATQERLAQAQSEGMLLRQQLEEVQNKGLAKERAVTDAQERFSDILSELRSDCQGKVQLVEERNKELAAKAADLRDQVYKLEEDRNEREASIRQLQQELADSLKKLAMSEASLEVNTHYRNDLGREKAQLLKDVERLTGKLEESEAQHMQAEKHVHSLKSSLGDREKELSIVAQKHQEALSASAASQSTIKQLEEAVQRLEIENARLEAAAKQQSNKLEVLQKGAQEASLARGHLEELVADLQRNKMTLEDQLSREVQKQSMLSHTAQDSQALWEEELKSRSKLGLRLAELEKEKGELGTQMEIERKKARKITEQKKAVDSRLEQEIMRNTELQKEMYRQRTLLKAAKKKLQAQDQRGVELSYSVSRHSQDGLAFGGKVGDLQVQLEKEATQRTELEKANRELNDQLASLKSLSRSNDQLERSKRQLEEEVLDLRRRMESTQMEQSQLEQYRRDIEEKARQEIKQKLAEVNLFLQSQAASQEALEQIQAANEANLRSHLEQKIRELEGELVRARSSQHDSASQRDSARGELERYRQLYTEELHLRQSLAAKLDRANSRLSEANSKLLSERSKPLLTGFAGPPLDMSSLGSPANNGASLGALNRSLGLGLSLLSPGSEAPNSRVEDYLARMRSELDRAISQELSSAAAELDVASTRLSPVGSASRELDPVSRAKQDYLEVLKKNYMI